MSARDKTRFTTAQAAWIALAVFAGWLLFLFAPTPRKARPPVSNELPPIAAQSKLESVGLTNNSDWLGMPDYFAIWAGSIDWMENRTCFAYWNPGSYSYSYFFKATREGAGIRFRAISAQEAGIGSTPVDEGLYFEEAELAQYNESRKGDSPTHPFVFPKKYISVKPQRIISAPR